MDEFNAYRYINIKYGDMGRDVVDTLDNYINSDEYEKDCKKYNSFNKGIDEYYKRMGE
jgi:hypothetical protein